jgi:hypothetical protein
MTTTYHFDKENIKAHDIFFAEHYDLNGGKFGHFFYCIYAQEEDKKLGLFRDVIGLLITTREPKGYIAELMINDKKAYVICDKEVRFFSDKKYVKNKYIKVSNKERKAVLKAYKQAHNEKLKQLRKGISLWK